MSSLSNSGATNTSLIQQVQPPQRGSFAARMKSDMQSALATAGVEQSKIPDIMKQIQDAIDKSRQNGGDRGDVKSAIQNVLKSNGVDTAKFETALQALHKGHHRGSHTANAQSAGRTNDGDADDQVAALQRQATGTGLTIDVAA